MGSATPIQLNSLQRSKAIGHRFDTSNHRGVRQNLWWVLGSERGETPSHFKQWMLTNADGYEDITYQPRGRTWFVLSGHRDDQIYYEKVIFSCGGRVVNVLAISYPEAQRGVFDEVVERMEDSFRGARRCS